MIEACLIRRLSFFDEGKSELDFATAFSVTPLPEDFFKMGFPGCAVRDSGWRKGAYRYCIRLRLLTGDRLALPSQTNYPRHQYCFRILWTEIKLKASMQPWRLKILIDKKSTEASVTPPFLRVGDTITISGELHPSTSAIELHMWDRAMALLNHYRAPRSIVCEAYDAPFS